MRQPRLWHTKWATLHIVLHLVPQGPHKGWVSSSMLEVSRKEARGGSLACSGVAGVTSRQVSPQDHHQGQGPARPAGQEGWEGPDQKCHLGPAEGASAGELILTARNEARVVALPARVQMIHRIKQEGAAPRGKGNGGRSWVGFAQTRQQGWDCASAGQAEAHGGGRGAGDRGSVQAAGWVPQGQGKAPEPQASRPQGLPALCFQVHQ